MQILTSSFLLVVLSEMGDKTQLLALILGAKFKRPVPVMMGILVATILNHALASSLGTWAATFVSAEALRWLLASTFFAFGLWMLVPDKVESWRSPSRWGPFWTTLVVFFWAEMGDKTQLATAALGAKFSSPVYVTLGTTLGMLVADGLAVAFGSKFTERLPMSMIHRISSAIFILFGIYILLAPLQETL